MFYGLPIAAQNDKVDSLKRLLPTLPLDTHRVRVLSDLAAQIGTNDYKASLNYVDEAVGLADSLGNVELIAYAHAQFSELQNHLGAYASSISHASIAYDAYATLPDTHGMARTLITIGLVRNSMKQHDKALESLRGAEKCYASIHNKKGIITARHNSAVVLTAAGDTVGAREVYQSNLGDLQGTTFNNILAATYNNLGNLFNPKLEGDSAIAYYLRSLEYKMAAKIPSKGSVGNTMLNIAFVHLENKRYPLAEEWMQRAEPFVIEANEKPRLLEYHRLRGELFFATSRFRESSLEYQAVAEVQDSLYGPEMTEQVARLEASFQSENQKKEIALLNKQRELDQAAQSRLRFITITTGVGLLLSVALTFLVIKRGRDRARMLRMLQTKNDEIHRQQQEILLQNEALSLRNKRLADLNQEKDGLIGVVAHDIRAPLNRSAALAELVASMGGLSPEQERYIQMIRKVSEDGGRLIQDLLEINAYESNTRPPDKRAVDLSELLEHTVHGFTKSAEEKDIELVWEPQRLIASTDDKLLPRIIDNLLSNAIKFTPKGKRVYISLVSHDGLHWIVIRDEGPGISEADQKKMFQKFQRLTPRPTGGESSTGLGLSIVRALCDRMGVQLQFESKIGQGSTFKIGLKPEA